jgi:RNHCP domain
MEPIAVWARPGGDWAIIHRCRTCGELHSNRIAGDDNELALIALAVRAISQPPFPLERLAPAADPADERWPAGLLGGKGGAAER